jgi:hypothetical protein
MMELGPRQQKFVDALRAANESEQIINIMKNDIGFCALGIACESSGLGDWIVSDGKNYPSDPGIHLYIVPDEEQDMGVRRHRANEKFMSGTYMPVSVTEYFQFHRNCGTLKENMVMAVDGIDWNLESISYMNDEIRLTFSEIADIIENDPNWFFKEYV